ncbi:MAG: nuclear transport factor 2 family protein [Acidobacteriota bacterium]
MRRIVSVALLLILASIPALLGQTKDQKRNGNSRTEREVRERLEQWADALKRNDVSVLEQILADDFQYILDDGKTRNKVEELAPSRAGDIKFESISIDDVKVFAYGDTAIATGVGTFKGTFKGRAFQARERFCDIYQKRKGQWKVIASRPVSLPMPKAP